MLSIATKQQHVSSDEFYMVAFADVDDNYIILQHAFEYDEQDIECGMDGEYIEVNSPDNSGYKRIKGALLSKDNLLITLVDDFRITISDINISDELINILKSILQEKLTII